MRIHICPGQEEFRGVEEAVECLKESCSAGIQAGHGAGQRQENGADFFFRGCGGAGTVVSRVPGDRGKVCVQRYQRRFLYPRPVRGGAGKAGKEKETGGRRMTLKELSQLYYLNRELETDKERLAALRASASAPGSPRYDDMPKSQGFENRLERYIAEIVDLESIIQAKITRCLHERNRLERYIAEIPDSLTRQIFQLRFIKGLNWVQIAFSVGGGNTDEGVRKRVYRYLGQEKQDKE